MQKLLGLKPYCIYSGSQIIKTINSKRSKLRRTRIHEYAPPPPNYRAVHATWACGELINIYWLTTTINYANTYLEYHTQQHRNNISIDLTGTDVVSLYYTPPPVGQ